MTIVIKEVGMLLLDLLLNSIHAVKMQLGDKEEIDPSFSPSWSRTVLICFVADTMTFTKVKNASADGSSTTTTNAHRATNKNMCMHYTQQNDF
jgi:hypothetical protein